MKCSAWSLVQMRSKKDFVHEEDVRTGPGWQRGWTNVVEGLELHKNLLSPAEQEIFIQAIKDWEAQGRRVSHLCPSRASVVAPVDLIRAKRGSAVLGHVEQELGPSGNPHDGVLHGIST